MNTQNKIIALIPARDGSKSIKHKNVQSLNNLPLFMHSINVAKASKNINEIYLLTNNLWYADIARFYKVKVPYLRSGLSSNDIAEDKSVLAEFIKHFKIEKYDESTIFVWLRPTHPFRETKIVDKAIDKFIESNFCSMRTVSLAKQTPYKMWKIYENNRLSRVIGEIEDGKHDAPRQTLPTVYWQDGYLDIFYPCAIKGSPCQLHDAQIGAIVSEEPVELSIDLDYPEDFQNAFKMFDNQNSKGDINLHSLNRKMDGKDVKRYGS